MAIVLMIAVQAHASEVDELRAQLEAMKADYQARIQALEARLAQLEAQSASAPPAPPAVAAEVAPPPAPPAAGGSSGNAFNPAISLILGGSYTRPPRIPPAYAIAGFMPSGRRVGPGERSFNLGESELTLAANVDPYFSGNLTAAITGDNEIEVEEAFFSTLALPDGFTSRADASSPASAI